MPILSDEEGDNMNHSISMTEEDEDKDKIDVIDNEQRVQIHCSTKVTSVDSESE